MLTIKDVAKIANVSVGTVSKYLNGIQVRSANAERIAAAISQTGYHPNISARTLKTRRSNTIAIILTNITGTYYPLIIKQIEYLLYEKGYIAILCDSNHNHELERKKINIMLDRQVDGMIIFPIDAQKANYQYILDHGTPLVTVDMIVPDLNCPQIVSDNISATFEATSCLLNEGKRHIAILLGPMENTSAADRLRGYLMAHESFGIKPQPALIKQKGFDEKCGYEAMRELWSAAQKPDAVIACSHHTATGAIRAIMDLGVPVGQTLDLIGFDHVRLPELTRKPMRIVLQSIDEIAQATVDCLMQSIAGAHNSGIRRIPTRLLSMEEALRAARKE